MREPMNEPRIIYITGHGHSGSTLLDMLLCNHSEIVSVGEVDLLSLHGSDSQDSRPCACGMPVTLCPFWSEVARLLGSDDSQMSAEQYARFWKELPTSQRTPASLRDNRCHLLKASLMLGSPRLFGALSWFSRHLTHYTLTVDNSWRVFDAVYSLTHARYIVDASKNPVRLRMLDWQRPGAVWQVHLVRDGRAIAASAKRRFQIPVRQSARFWRSRYRDVRWLERGIPAERRHMLRYEDLCDDQEGALRRLCQFLDITYEPTMREMRLSGHGLDGNLLRYDAARRQTVAKDERWKRELTAADLRDFDRVAGSLNRRLGYA